MLTSDEEIRDYLRRRLRNNITKPALGGKYFFLKEGHNLYERDPYDKRLIKAIIIELLGTVNKDACERCQEGRGAFVGCTSIKSWMDGCCSNCKKFDACTQCSVSDSYKQEQKEAEKVTRERSQSMDITTKSGRATRAPAKYSG
jgi:Protein of unknown function (DUF3716)